MKINFNRCQVEFTKKKLVICFNLSQCLIFFTKFVLFCGGDKQADFLGVIKLFLKELKFLNTKD